MSKPLPAVTRRWMSIALALLIVLAIVFAALR